MNDLRELPRNSAVRKINELVKRCRLAKASHLLGMRVPKCHYSIFRSVPLRR